MNRSGPKVEHILLFGISDAGKTKFLYETLLQNKWNGTIHPSMGYNYELVKQENLQFGVWDLAGGTEFQELWAVFFKFIPFSATIFVVRLYYKGLKNKDNEAKIAEARKRLHYIAFNPHFKDKPIFLIINVPNDCLDNDSGKTDDDKDKQRRELAQETIKTLHWENIPEPKASSYIDLTNQQHFIRVLGEFYQLWAQTYKK